MVNKKPKPVGVCRVCMRAVFELNQVGDQCQTVILGCQCRGTVIETTNMDDWCECLTCHGTGDAGDEACLMCNDAGWLFTRPGGFDGAWPRNLPMVMRVD